ncbi:hypothetical protein ACJSDX_04715 [Methylobacillus sp. Pita1]
MFFNDFLSAIRKDLRRIVYQSAGEYSMMDMENETYLLLEEFFAAHGRYPDLYSEEKGWVPAWLTIRFIKRMDYRLKYALRIHAFDEEDSFRGIDIPAPENSNPLFYLLWNESSREKQQLITRSYSEAKAYIVSFDQFDHDKQALSTHFCITTKTLEKRVGRSIQVCVTQPSLFDRIEVIDDSFMPCPGKLKPNVRIYVSDPQLSWQF